MTDSTDHRQYVCGARIVVCTMAHSRWSDQKGCEKSIKDPIKDKCWYADHDGICHRDRMEHEGA